MKRLLLFFICISAFASQSAIWSNSVTGYYITPSSGSGNWWGALSAFNAEANVTSLTAPVAQESLWEVAGGGPAIFVDTSGNVGGSGVHNEQVFLPLNGCASFRVRYQRFISPAIYSLELWCESTGQYSVGTKPDTSIAPGAYSFFQTSIGSFNHLAQQPVANIGAVRVFPTTVAIGSAAPARLLTSSFAGLLDAELEGNQNDSSPLAMTWTVGTGTISYTTTPVTNPGLSQTANTVNVGSTAAGAAITGLTAFANNDNPALTYAWSRTAGVTGSFSATNVLSPTWTGSGFGDTTIQLIATDINSNATTFSSHFGSVVLTPGTNNVDIAAEAGGGATGSQIAQLLGPSMMYGTNPWGWFDVIGLTAANQQIVNQTTFFSYFWLTPSTHGTISCLGGNTSATCTGTGTQFKADFCAGGTSPQSPYNTGIVIYYPSSIYGGATGYAHYYINSCPDDTHIVLGTPGGSLAWLHTTANLVNAQYYADPAGVSWFNWAYGPIPANYYDNVLAFYREYYKTGLASYLTAARYLANGWFYGPFWDSGMSFNYLQVLGCCLLGDSALIGRGISAAGVIVWALESSTNIWPGIAYVWSMLAHDVTVFKATGQIGDIRDAGYTRSILSLCVLYDPSPPAGCATGLTDAVDNWWAPLETVNAAVNPPAPNNMFQQTGFGIGNISNNSGEMGCGSPCYVTVTNGQTLVTATGAAWTCGPGGSFFNQYIPAGNGGLNAFLWFFDDPTNPNVPGNSNRGDSGTSPPLAATGDNITYLIDPNAACTSTTVHLLVPYAGVTGNHGLELSFYTGFGSQTFTTGLAAGMFGDWDVNAFNKLSQPTEAALAKKHALDMMSWLQTTGTNTSLFYLYQARGFLNCEGYVDSATPPGGWTPDNDGGCTSAGNTIYNAEIVHACVASYRLSPSPSLRTFCDKIFTAMFCKGGYTCAGYSQVGTDPFYNWELEPYPYPAAYMITIGPNGLSAANTNKWFGYYFGFSYADAWAVVRQTGSGSSSGVVSGRSVMSGAAVVH